MIEGLSSMQSVSSTATGSSSATGATSSVSNARSMTSVIGADGQSFGDMLAQIGAEAAQTLKAGEAMSINGINGKVNAQQVVDAIMSAERSLQTAIAVRDKVVGAYQEISRMAI